MWYELDDIEQSPSGEVRARVVVEESSPWFSGHFPEEPILPGIAQIGMVLEVLSRTCNQPLKIVQVSRVRFKQVVRPNECLHIIVMPMERQEGAYSFRLMVEETLVCNGNLVLEPLNA